MEIAWPKCVKSLTGLRRRQSLNAPEEQNTIHTMIQTVHSMLGLSLAAVLLASCVVPPPRGRPGPAPVRPGVSADRREDVRDRREDYWDRRTYTGPGDRREDVRDRREDYWDRRTGPTR